MSQSTQDIEYGWNGDSTTLNSNFIRDIQFGGDEKKYVVVSTLIGAVGVYTGFVNYPMLAGTSAVALILGRGTQGNAGASEIVGKNNTTGSDWTDRTSNLADQAPIKIPSNATVKFQVKNGYDQITFKWSENGYTYEVRWHTKTPGVSDG